MRQVLFPAILQVLTNFRMRNKYIIIGGLVIAAAIGLIAFRLKNNPAAKLDAQASVKSSRNYQNFTPELFTSELATGKKVVIFFYADWCPDCRAADENFKSKSELIPTDVSLLKIEYGSNKELERKYGVFSRHTFVQVDNNGKQVTKWISGDVDQLKKNIK